MNDKLIAGIADLERAEQSLRLTQFAVDHAGDAIFWVDREANFNYVNEAACPLLGYSQEELLEMNVFDVDAVGVDGILRFEHSDSGRGDIE